MRNVGFGAGRDGIRFALAALDRSEVAATELERPQGPTCWPARDFLPITIRTVPRS